MSHYESSYKKMIQQKVTAMFGDKDEELKALVLAHELHTDPKEREKAVEETVRDIKQSQEDIYNELVELGFITSPENITPTTEEQ